MPVYIIQIQIHLYISTMSRSVSALRYLDAAELFQWIKQGHTQLGERFQVVDVRGSDYIGGHIIDGWHYSYKKLAHDDLYLHELIKNLDGLVPMDGTDDAVVNVVFHCAQSQQRGPRAAMRVLRTLTDEQLNHCRIWILRGGFNHWQDTYGEDDTVTEGYEPSLWGW